MGQTKWPTVAMAYCGAVVGAGFATGREIMSFFTIYGSWGLLGVAVATALFMWAGIVILDITHRLPVYSYKDVLQHILYYPPLVIMVDLLLMATLVTGVGVMTAAGGAVLTQWGIPVGTTVFLVICVLILGWGGRGYMQANSILVPIIVLIVVLLSIMQVSVPATSIIRPVASGVLYAAYNIAIALMALSTLKEYLDAKSVRWGGLVGGAITGLLLVVVYGATLNLPQHLEIPMLKLAEVWLGGWQWIYQVALLAAVLTTALANMQGLVNRVRLPGNIWITLTAVAGAGWVLSQMGFANLVRLLYPLLGLCNIVLLLGLCYYSFAVRQKL